MLKKIFKIKKISTKIILSITIIFIILVGAMLFIISDNVKSSIQKFVYNDLSKTASVTKSSFKVWIDSKKITLHTFANSDYIKRAVEDTSYIPFVRAFFKNNVEASKDVEDIFIIDKNGFNIIDAWSKEGIDNRDFDFYKALSNGTNFWVDTSVIKSPVSNKTVFVIGVPIKKDNETIAYVCMSLYLDYFVDNFLKDLVIGKSGYAVLINSKGEMIYHPDSTLFLKNLTSVSIVKNAIKNKKGVDRYFFRGRWKLGSYEEYDYSKFIVIMTSYESEFFEVVYKFRYLLLLMSLIGLIIMVLFLLYLIKKLLINKFNDFKTEMKKGEEGNLSINVEKFDTENEIGEIVLSFSGFINKLKEYLFNVQQLSDHLSSAITEISSTSQQLSVNTDQTTEQIGSIAGAITEITSNVNEINTNAEVMREKAINSSQLTELSTKKNEKLVDKVNELSSKEVKFVDDLKNLQKSSEEITNIIKVIEDIADQTNLLALNAAIEAARAGEHGRGFAVVADEVRKLAEKTQSSTKEIADTITEILKKIEFIVSSISENVETINELNKDIVESSEMVNQVNVASNETVGYIEQIVSALNEQKKAMDDILTNIESINVASNENSNGLAQIVQTISDLNIRVVELSKLTSYYKVNYDKDYRINPGNYKDSGDYEHTGLAPVD